MWNHRKSKNYWYKMVINLKYNNHLFLCDILSWFQSIFLYIGSNNKYSLNYHFRFRNSFFLGSYQEKKILIHKIKWYRETTFRSWIFVNWKINLSATILKQFFWWKILEYFCSKISTPKSLYRISQYSGSSNRNLWNLQKILTKR